MDQAKEYMKYNFSGRTAEVLTHHMPPYHVTIPESNRLMIMIVTFGLFNLIQAVFIENVMTTGARRRSYPIQCPTEPHVAQRDDPQRGAGPGIIPQSENKEFAFRCCRCPALMSGLLNLTVDVDPKESCAVPGGVIVLLKFRAL